MESVGANPAKVQPIVRPKSNLSRLDTWSVGRLRSWTTIDLFDRPASTAATRCLP